MGLLFLETPIYAIVRSPMCLWIVLKCKIEFWRLFFIDNILWWPCKIQVSFCNNLDTNKFSNKTLILQYFKSYLKFQTTETTNFFSWFCQWFQDPFPISGSMRYFSEWNSDIPIHYHIGKQASCFRKCWPNQLLHTEHVHSWLWYWRIVHFFSGCGCTMIYTLNE